MARELINRIQNIRKDSGLEITDRVHVTIQPEPGIEKAVASFGDYIQSQVLADSITLAENDGEPVELDEFTTHIKVVKA